MTDFARGSDRRQPHVAVLSLAGLAALWWLAAWAMADPDILPSPPQVWAVIRSEAAAGELFLHMGATLTRVLAAFGLAMGLGTVLGVLLGLYRGLDRWLDPWVIVFLNLPALVIIVLCYLWIGLNELAAVVAVSANKTAMVIVTMREAVRSRDHRLMEMAQVFGMSPWARLRHVLWPQLVPFFATAVRNGLAVIWKVVLVVEFLGRSSGVGFQIHLYFQLFDTATVLAYSLSFVAVMLVIEVGIVQALERRALAWRRKEAAAQG